MFFPEGIITPKVITIAPRVVRAGVIIGSIVAFGWVALSAIPSINNLVHVRWPPLVGAIILQLMTLFALMAIWERLLGILWSPGDRTGKIPRCGLYTAYSRSWLARYVPGRIWSLGGRALMASRLGVPIEAVARSMAIEVIFTYALVTIIGGSLLLGAGLHILMGGTTLVAGLVAFAASVFTFQRILNKGLCSSRRGSTWSRIRQWTSKLVIGDTYFPVHHIVWGVLLYGSYAVMQLGVIVLVAASFTDIQASQAAIIAGAWGVSLTIGWISFVAPVGLGVRDGLAFALFTLALDAPAASLIVMASRIIMLATDVAFVGAVELLALGLNPSRRGIATDGPELNKVSTGNTPAAAP